MAYTARQILEAALTETNKAGAPSMLLADYNYFINKAINQYVNQHYTIYDVSQQTTDDLRVLKSQAMLKVKNVSYRPEIGGDITDMNKLGAGLAKMFAGTYEVILPSDYLHMLNCKCIYKMLSDYKCYDKGNDVPFDALRLTADAKSQIDGNAYLTPKPWRPYYCIQNINISDEVATNPRNEDLNPYGTDYVDKFKTDYSNLKLKPFSGTSTNFITKSTVSTPSDTTVDSKTEGIPYIGGIDKGHIDKNLNDDNIGPDDTVDENTKLNKVEDSDKENHQNDGFKRTISIKNPYTGGSVDDIDIVDVKPAGLRLGNATGVRCEILCGKDDSVFKLRYVLIDYIKAPQHVRITQEQYDLIKDTSQIMEFPDYVCQEIINELIKLILEFWQNQRLGTHPQVSQSINYQQSAPQQQQAQQRQQNG